MVCPRCGYANAPNEESCGRCGHALLPGSNLVQERRWVSVVFFDLSRFSEYALAHPLEDVWQAVNTALQTASNHVRLFGGHIDKYFGDGFLAVFGVPRSQESDAKAALEAARAMVASSTLPGRAGVASGLVLRTPLGGGLAGDQTVLGPAVNLSQRLSQAAPPGEVWADETTIRLLPTASCEPLPPQPLKGYAEPLSPFRYLGVQAGPSTILGRDNEVALFEENLKAVQAGAGRRLVIYGPMGIGKSYLAQYLVSHLPEGVRGIIAPRLTSGVALRYALRQGLQELLRGGPPVDQLGQLLPENLQPILAYSIGLEEHPGIPPHELDALLIQTWWQVLAKVSAMSPLVLVIEDLHNSDPTVLEFSRRAALAGVLLVLVARQNRWEPAPDLQLMSLQPLSLEDTQQLILQARPDLGPATSLHLAEASAGFPLAVQALSINRNGEPEPIPLYQPRLDSLPRLARAALQAAAVLGPTCPPELVRHLVGEEADLGRLVGEGFLEADENGQLKFAIPWLREAILGQVGGPQVQGWHQQAAKWYQRQNRLADSATHLEAAGDIAPAYRIWRIVAQEAWNNQNYSGALLGYLEALRLSEGSLRWSSALEAAEAHLALGRYHEALDLALLPLDTPDIPVSIRERSRAVRLEAALGLGVTEDTDLPTPADISEPRLKLALARMVSPGVAARLVDELPSNLEASGLLVRARGWLELGELEQARAITETYLQEYRGNPAERFQAQLLLSETLWRQANLGPALLALGSDPGEALPPYFSALYKSRKATFMLDLGKLEESQKLLSEAQVLIEQAPAAAFGFYAQARMRYLVESGQIEEALGFGEFAVANAPSPQILARFALAHAFAPGQDSWLMVQRFVKGLEGQSPEVEALCSLAVGLRRWYRGESAKADLRTAVLLARKGKNPPFFYYSLMFLGLLYQEKEVGRAMALSQYLLAQTGGHGFVVQNGFARLLRAQLLMRQSREIHGLLDFEPVLPLAKAWHHALTQPDISDPMLAEQGILSIWARWVRSHVQIDHPNESLEAALSERTQPSRAELE
jgi:class 3 adenylate cyclase/tetratricopeptide (TPR) repeat protein